MTSQVVAPMETYTGRIVPVTPFDFGQTLRFAGSFHPARGEQIVAEGALAKAIMVAGRPVGFHVTSESTALTYTLTAAEPLTPALIAACVDRLRFYLSLDDDLGPIYELAREDVAMAPVIARLYGLHQVKFPTPFETAAWAVLTQRTPIAVARVVKDRLVERYGAPVANASVDLWAFSEAQTLVAADPDELGALVRNERKFPYLLAVSAAFAQTDETWLRTGAYDEVEAWLHAIPGIGAWSAAFILLRGLGRMERVAPNEPLLKATARVYGEVMT